MASARDSPPTGVPSDSLWDGLAEMGEGCLICLSQTVMGFKPQNQQFELHKCTLAIAFTWYPGVKRPGEPCSYEPYRLA